ncbi:hypothetical protein SAMN04488007_2374 [Maribacter aquivivus]|uniref:Orphan protein n=1 Tax=Maribacter aquivivus TaxID=228958 RepID=A0A1M6QKT9_9FLAO|nr:DUF6515 family protein [Maribacter aquivivus]SHK20909.1 hypothetical protein SAMN04488007_2374 [Maribacter aquivivus]
MKTNTKTYVVLGLFLVAFALPSTAQTRKKTATKTTTTRTTTVTKTPGRVSSKRVQYRTPTKKVVSVRTVPNRSIVKHNGQNYYYANNRYYTQSRGRYIAIAPKIGFRIQSLPPNYARVRFNNHLYFNVGGTFYVEANSGYEVVDPEIGTVVSELPDGYEKVTIDGFTYYEYSNILYEKIQVNGSRAYEVVGIIDME